MIEWLCQIRTKQNDNMISQSIILLQVFIFGISYCELNGRHIEITIGVGPLSASSGVSLWNNLLP